MRIPSQLFIHGQVFDIQFRDEKEMIGELGKCDVNHNTIFLRHGLNDEKLAEVLLHEVIHGVAEMINMTLTENEVNNLAVGLMPILRHQKLDLTV